MQHFKVQESIFPGLWLWCFKRHLERARDEKETQGYQGMEGEIDEGTGNSIR